MDGPAKLRHFPSMRRTEDQIPRFLLYGEPPGEAALRFIHLETIPARSRLANWEIRPHRHDALHQFLLVQAGGGRFRADAGDDRFAAPALLTVPPRLVHGFAFNPETQGLVLSVGADAIAGLVSEGPGRDLLPATTGPLLLEFTANEPGWARLDAAFAEIAHELDWPDAGGTAAILAQLALILVQARRRAARGDDRDRRTSPDALLVARLRQAVEEHLGEHWAVEDYAAGLGVSPGRLNAACRRVAACSTLQLIHLRLLTEARRHLVYTAMTVAEIAYTLGFEDPAYFSRFFTKREGMAPLAFRARHGLAALPGKDSTG